MNYHNGEKLLALNKRAMVYKANVGGYSEISNHLGECCQ